MDIQSYKVDKEIEEQNNMISSAGYDLYEVNYGIAANYGDCIELHKCLRDVPGFRKQIINHELEHTKGFHPKDIVHDVTDSHLRNLKFLPMLKTNPETAINFMPLKWVYSIKKIGINWGSIFYLGIGFIIPSILMNMIIKIGLFNWYLYFWNFTGLINLVVVLLLHLYIKKNGLYCKKIEKK